MPLRTVAVLLADQAAAFEYGVVHEVFGIDRTEQGVPAFEFRVCAEHPERPVDFQNGLSLNVPYGLEGLKGADLVAVPATHIREFSPGLLAAIRAAHDAGAILLSVCSGAFVLGAAGLLDGRECATHWMSTAELAQAYPLARVNRDVLFVDDGDIITSAGTAAGIDACLHLVRREMGASVATTIARRMVVPPQRDGGQRQFVEMPIPECATDSLRAVLLWMEENLHEEQPVSVLARRAAMSERTFARRFVAETGTTPAKWLALQRVHRARELLESSDLAIDQVASRSGFGSAALLRHHFLRQVGVAPSDYRRMFSRTHEPALAVAELTA
jgi:transcriptional regulator GlxA family with amidase domain